MSIVLGSTGLATSDLVENLEKLGNQEKLTKNAKKQHFLDPSKQ